MLERQLSLMREWDAEHGSIRVNHPVSAPPQSKQHRPEEKVGHGRAKSVKQAPALASKDQAQSANRVSDEMIAEPGPSNMRPQVGGTIVSDAELAQQLQDALDEEAGRTSFRLLNRDESPMPVDDNDGPDHVERSDEEARGAKGKARRFDEEEYVENSAADRKGKGRAKAKVGQTARPAAGEKTDGKGKGRRVPPKTSGKEFHPPCQKCQSQKARCEIDEHGGTSGACVRCRQKKVRCSKVAGNPRPRARHPKSKPNVSDSEDEQGGPSVRSLPTLTGAVQPVPVGVRAPRQAAAAAAVKARRMIAAETSADERVKRKARPRKKRVTDEDITEQVQRVVEGSYGPRMIFSNYIYFLLGYLERVNEVDESSTDFRHLFSFLGNALSHRHHYLQQRADWLNEVAIGVIELAEERMQEVGALQRRQNLLFEMLIKVATDGMPQVDSELGGREMMDAWNELLRKEQEAMEETQQTRRRMLTRMKQRLDRFQKTPDLLNEEGERRAQTEIRDLLRESQRALLARVDGGNTNYGRAGGNPDSDQMDVDEQAGETETPAMKVEDPDMRDLTRLEPPEIVVPASLVGQAIDSPPSEPPPTIRPETIPLTAPEPLYERAAAEPQPETLTPPPVQGPHLSRDLHETSRPVEEVSSAHPAKLPAVNLISPTPQNSQEELAGTVTQLVVPHEHHNGPRPRSRSRTPVPPESQMITRSKSRSQTPGHPADSNLLAVTHHPARNRSRSNTPIIVDSGDSRGEKRKASREPEEGKKRRKE